MNESELKKYASLIVRKGVNLQEKQGVIIYSNVEATPLVNLIEKECELLGASKIIKLLSDEEVIKEQLNNLDTFIEPEMDISGIKSFVRIRIRTEGLSYLNDVGQEKLIKYNAIGRKNHKYLNDRVDQWTIVAYPGKSWAKDVFPNLDEKDAVETLWKLIKKAVRLDGNPIDNWVRHDENLYQKCTFLNNLKIKTLHYKSSNGTDFSISLKPNVLFIGGSVNGYNGMAYEPNMPSEEIYTAPDPSSANGVVFATKPLYLYGKIYKDFGFRFKDGVAIEMLGNKEAKELFTYLFQNVPNSNRLGEVALVPFDSPISQINTLFYKNLFDENASCHLALGDAILDAIKDYNKLSSEEISAYGLNRSSVHIDFMIGTPDLEIVAESYEGKTIKLFENGNWIN